MLFTVIKALIGFFVVFMVWTIYKKFVIPLSERKRLMKQGVVYLEKPIRSEIKCFR